MKIILDNIIFSLQRSGGISVVWENLLQAIQSEKMFQPIYIEYQGAVNNMCRKRLLLDAIENRTPRITLRVESLLRPIVHECSPFIFHSSYYRVCKNPKAINITTVHDFTYEYYRHGLAKYIHSWQKFKAIRESDIVVCISENTKNDVLKFLPDVCPEKVRVIHNGVSETYFPCKVQMYNDLGTFLLFVSGRQQYKKFDLVVETARRVGMKLVIVGAPLSDTEVKMLNSQLGIDGYIAFSHINDDELNALYNSAYCLVYPSLYEGFGIPIIEAQRAGCPVIAYNASSIPEVVGKTPLLLDQLSVEGIIERLRLLEDKNLRASIVENGLNHSKQFSWRKMAEAYIQLYKEIYYEHL